MLFLSVLRVVLFKTVKILTELDSRYLCKLTDRQICLMTEDDVASFKWKGGADTEEDFVDKDDSDDICVEYEVQEDQQQKEDFSIREGFQVYAF